MGRPLPTPVQVPNSPRQAFDLDHAMTRQEPERRSYNDRASDATSPHGIVLVSGGNLRPEPTAQTLPINETPSLRGKLGKRSAGSPIFPKKTKRLVATTLNQDRLGTLVSELSQKLNCASSWEEFVEQVRGKSYLAQDVGCLPHTAGPYLQQI